MQLNSKQHPRGVTLTELIVVLAIVSLLATIALPVAINRNREAKFAVAQAEVEALAKGEEMCGTVHGYYVPLQLLDNLPRIAGRDPIRTDDIANELSSIFLIDVDINPFQQLSSQPNLGSSILKVQRLESEWAGPFVQPQRVFESAATPPSSTWQRRDFPLDPWGYPYRLYSPEGIVGNTTVNTIPTFSTIDSDTFSNGVLSNVDDRFDRYAVVSFGPDAISDGPNPGTAPTDDIIYFFGSVPRRTDTVN